MVVPDKESWNDEDLKVINALNRTFLFHPCIPKYLETSVDLRPAFPLASSKFLSVQNTDVMFASRLDKRGTDVIKNFYKQSLGENWEEIVEDTVVETFISLVSELQELHKMFEDPSQEDAPESSLPPSVLLH